MNAFIKTIPDAGIFLGGKDVPAGILKNEFYGLVAPSIQSNYLEIGGRFYHITEFMPVTDDMPNLKDWHGFLPTSSKTAILIRIEENRTTYRYGIYYRDI